MDFMKKETSREWVARCEDDFRHRLTAIADAIGQTEGLRICTLTGPTCSGKTTAAAMLVRHLASLGKRAHIVSLDDFYYDTDYLHRLSREKGLGHLDYDSVDTIDLVTLRRFTEEILTGTTVHAPVFDFREGRRTGLREMTVGREELVIFEGIQTGYPEVRALLSHKPFASIVIMPQASLAAAERVFSPHEIRLMRRIVRDDHFRNTGAEVTLSLWEGVRRNEEAHIFPFVGECDYTIDSTMAYELGVLRPYLEQILGALSKSSPYRPWADALLRALSSVEVIPADLIGPDSLYREFI